jgi:hypothetical protein
VRLAPIIAKLAAAGFTKVEGAMEFAGLAEAPRAPLSLFVVPDAEEAAANRMAGVIDQKVRASFLVIIVLATAVRARDGSDPLRDQIEAVQQALLGWTHPDSSVPTEYAGGRLMAAEGGRLVWSVRFSTAYHLRRHAQ